MIEARSRGLLTIAMSGGNGGELARSAAVDYCFTAPAITCRAFRRRTRRPGMRCCRWSRRSWGHEWPRPSLRGRIPPSRADQDARDRDRATVRGSTIKIMEVCGGHTHAIYKHGLEDLLPSSIDLVHGPGCPVCVIPMGRLDDAIAIAREPEVIFTTFGDMMRVPSSRVAVCSTPRPRARMCASLFATRCAEARASGILTARSCFLRSVSKRLPRPRPRPCCARAPRDPQLLRLLQPRDDRPGDQGDSRFAGHATARVHWPRARQHDYRLAAVRVRAPALRVADGRLRL